MVGGIDDGERNYEKKKRKKTRRSIRRSSEISQPPPFVDVHNNNNNNTTDTRPLIKSRFVYTRIRTHQPSKGPAAAISKETGNFSKYSLNVTNVLCTRWVAYPRDIGEQAAGLATNVTRTTTINFAKTKNRTEPNILCTTIISYGKNQSRTDVTIKETKTRARAIVIERITGVETYNGVGVN